MNATQLIYGVDFSGSQWAGKWIWISCVSLAGSNPVMEGCIPGKQLPGSGPSRELCLPALSQFIRAHGAESVFGLDFPFSLPSTLLRETDWDTFVLSFGEKFKNCDSFKQQCFQMANNRELRRLTDTETGTPWSPYNLRLYRQTYFGIRDVIGPLLQSGSAWFAPMQKPAFGKPLIVEVCPASTLKRRYKYGIPYKKNSPAHAYARRKMLSDIKSKSAIRIRDSNLEDTIISEWGGNALDSLIAAWAVYETLCEQNLDSNKYAIEGRVYT